MFSAKIFPNILTLLRIIFTLIIIFLFLTIKQEANNTNTFLIILILYALASIFDYLDGMLARKLNAVTRFGRVLDPIADKILVAGCLLSFIYLARLYAIEPIVIPALFIILRDIFISGLREFMAFERYQITVSPLAKWKTSLEMLSIGVILFYLFFISTGLANFTIKHMYLLKQVSYFSLWCTALLSLITAGQYVFSLRGAFKHQKLNSKQD